MTSSPGENADQLQPTSSADEQLGLSAENVQNNAADADNINGRTVQPPYMLLIASSTEREEVDAIPESSGSILTDVQQNEGERQRLTTTGTQSNTPTDRHISEWGTEEVLAWFQSHKLDQLHNFVFASGETQDGAALKKIFELKLKNYEQYRNVCQNRLPSNSSSLLKDFTRFGQLLDTYFIDKYSHRFDVAFSFPGDIRDRVSEIAEKLRLKINGLDGQQRVFYDRYHQAELARPNLDLYLHAIYRYQTRLIVVFMCADYARKEWCGLEARAIRSLMKTHQNDRIMLLTVDGTTIDGVLDIDGYMDISQENSDKVVDAIYQRLQALGDPLPPLRSSHKPRGQLAPPNVISDGAVILRNAIHSTLPWYIIVALLSYILGTFIGR